MNKFISGVVITVLVVSVTLNYLFISGRVASGSSNIRAAGCFDAIDCEAQAFYAEARK